MTRNGVILGAMPTENELREALVERDRAWRSKIKNGAYIAVVFFGLWILKAWLSSGATDEFGNQGDQMSLFEAAHFVFAKTLDCIIVLGIIGLVCWAYYAIKDKLKRNGHEKS